MAVFGENVHLDFDKNVLFYEIEKYDDTDLSALPEEVREEIAQANLQFLTEVVENHVKDSFSVCNCLVSSFLERNEQRRKILNLSPQGYVPEISQDDLDSYRYAVIVVSEHGYMTGISCVMRECLHCHEIKYWGNVETFAGLMAEVTTNFISAQLSAQAEEAANIAETIGEVDTDAENPLGPDAMLTNIPGDDDAYDLAVENISDAIEEQEAAEADQVEAEPVEEMPAEAAPEE